MSDSSAMKPLGEWLEEIYLEHYELKLIEAGVTKVKHMRGMTAEDIARVVGMKELDIPRMREALNRMFSAHGTVGMDKQCRPQNPTYCRYSNELIW